MLMKPPRLAPAVTALCVGLLCITGSAATFAERIIEPDAGDELLPLGTTQGLRAERIVIRGGIMVTGRGTPGRGRAAPPEGPVDIVIENERIVDIIPIDSVSVASGLSERTPGDLIIDASGKYVLPGLFDLHTHIPSPQRAGDDSFAYAFRLWLGHGVTTLRDAGSDAGLERLVEQRRLAEEHAAVAPRLVLHKRWPNTGRVADKGHTPQEARRLVRAYHERGADGIKVSHGPGHHPDILEAIADEAAKLDMRGVMVDLKVSETDGLVASRAGVVSIEHWYGIPDAALPGTQSFPLDYNYLDELARFREAGHLWQEAVQRPEALGAVIDELIDNGTAWVPTFSVYETNRDFVRALTLPWRERYGHPRVLDRWRPRPDVHASYHSEWTTADEVAWRNNYVHWMTWVREFFQRGGLLGLGADSGSLQSLYGFGTIRELELMQEAGIHPLDIVRIATTNSARIAGLEEDLCGIRFGCVADLIVVDGNPLENFKVLYGGGLAYFGTPREGEGGVIWTIKAGEVFDAQALLREAEWYVREAER
jgi:cytosine/adenosine deaminase-related metal-dependent hydrolase